MLPSALSLGAGGRRVVLSRPGSWIQVSPPVAAPCRTRSNSCSSVDAIPGWAMRGKYMLFSPIFLCCQPVSFSSVFSPPIFAPPIPFPAFSFPSLLTIPLFSI
ncbi:hypothetical protein GDO86_007793 [Hymenochirus boettgeri]|uniref:Uncharacterized protein n=1 Tax=Hymenochirus boettgeri TaxID=247094 RepID=A0A8T2IV42_9PIPI|nr:hypothetical protein GDO86_007793 [Hymenochirus boettgeri]